MKIWDHLEFDNHEAVHFGYDAKTNLRCIIAIHNTTLGPALGGCRYFAYDSDEKALEDVLRLSKGMTYKAALAGLNLGGGKSVIIKPSDEQDQVFSQKDLFEAFGRIVHQLSGRYITAEDVGTSTTHMGYIKTQTPHVRGLENESGDPSLFTALGVFHAMRAGILKRFNQSSFKDLTIAVQGLGSVGFKLCSLLTQAGAHVIGCDVHEDVVKNAIDTLGIKAVGPDEIMKVHCDVLSPCAMGASLNAESIKDLTCNLIAGCANNQLSKPKIAQDLQNKNILYLPDYMVNAGGLINVSSEGNFYKKEEVLKKVEEIYNTTLQVYDLAQEKNLPMNLAADLLAQRRFQVE